MNEIWMEAAYRCGDAYGKPLPKKILELGSPDREWGVRFNASETPLDGIPPYHMAVTWGGFPAGIIGPDGGILAAGSAANEDTFLEWLRELAKPGG